MNFPPPATSSNGGDDWEWYESPGLTDYPQGDWQPLDVTITDQP